MLLYRLKNARFFLQDTVTFTYGQFAAGTRCVQSLFVRLMAISLLDELNELVTEDLGVLENSAS